MCVCAEGAVAASEKEKEKEDPKKICTVDEIVGERARIFFSFSFSPFKIEKVGNGLSLLVDAESCMQLN